MKAVKDNFTIQSGLYARYRPVYPPTLYTFLLSLITEKQAAWDCGTGNGQVATELSSHFQKVFATDISEQQIINAVKKDNIFYSVQRAETTSFPNHSFDLITVAQAIHWFDFDLFYKEVLRTIKPGGILAVIGYGLFTADKETDQLLNDFYHHIIGPYWDEERKYIDENYQTIPFPFTTIPSPDFTINYEWSLGDLTGYLETWSAVQHYIKANNQNPVELIKDKLENLWPEGSVKPIRFPVLLKLARIRKS
jgi:SAM-dependent methyltransferase